jgi:hypothetical protein
VKVRSQPVRDAARGRVVFAVQQRKAALNSRDNRLDLFLARPPKSGGVSHCHSGIDNLLDDVARVLGSLQQAQDHPRLNVIDAGAGRLHRRQGSLDVEPALAGPQFLLAVAVMSIALGGFCLARQQRAVGVQVEHVVEFRNVVDRAARLDGPARPRFSALRVVGAGMTQQRCTVSWLQVAGQQLGEPLHGRLGLRQAVVVLDGFFEIPDQVQSEPAVANFARRQYQPLDALQNRVAPLRDILEVEVGDDAVEVCNRVLAARPCAVLQPADAVVHAASRLVLVPCEFFGTRPALRTVRVEKFANGALGAGVGQRADIPKRRHGSTSA